MTRPETRRLQNRSRRHDTVHPPTVEWGAPAKIAAFQFQVFASSPGPNETRYPFWQETEYGAECPRVTSLPELAGELRRFPAVIDEDRIFPPKSGAKSGRQRVEGSFEDLLKRAGIKDFRFHDLRHTFASWFMMNGGDLYELAKILGHSNIKMTERYRRAGREHIARTGSTAREIWKQLEGIADKTNVC